MGLPPPRAHQKLRPRYAATTTTTAGFPNTFSFADRLLSCHSAPPFYGVARPPRSPLPRGGPGSHGTRLVSDARNAWPPRPSADFVLCTCKILSSQEKASECLKGKPKFNWNGGKRSKKQNIKWSFKKVQLVPTSAFLRWQDCVMQCAAPFLATPCAGGWMMKNTRTCKILSNL